MKKIGRLCFALLLALSCAHSRPCVCPPGYTPKEVNLGDGVYGWVCDWNATQRPKE